MRHAVTQTISVCRRSGQSVLARRRCRSHPGDARCRLLGSPRSARSGRVLRPLPERFGSPGHSRRPPPHPSVSRQGQRGCGLRSRHGRAPARSARTGRSAPTGAAWLSRARSPSRSSTTGRRCRPGRASRPPRRSCNRAGGAAPPARVGDAAGEAVVAQHPGDVQVLDHHRPIGAGQGAREVVQGVAAQVGDLGVRLGEPAAGLLPALGRLAAAAVGGEGPRRRASWRLRRRNRRCACWSGAGLGTRRPSDSTARWRMPTSTPTRQPGRCGPGTARCTWQVKLTNQRPPCRLMVAARIRAVPCSRRRASLRVDSWVRIRPSRGKTT